MPTAVTKECFDNKQVAKHDNEDDIWVSFEGGVYDLTNFIEEHPGGKDVIMEWAGKDITNVFYDLHTHSLYAQQLLNECRIGDLLQQKSSESNIIKDNTITHRGNYQSVPDSTASSDAKEPKLNQEMSVKKDDNFLDINRPIISQVLNSNWSKNYYLEQIHIPRHVKKSPQFFNSIFLEIFTKTPWYGVLLFWLPIVYFLVKYALKHFTTGWTIHLMLDGVVLWTLYEYIFHRCFFHMDEKLPDHKVAMMLHFLTHGVHHLFPADKYRLVMPPLMMSIFSSIVAFGWYLILGGPTTAALMAGSFLGYLVYDMMHYYSHHGVWMNGYLRKMKTYHLDHHYVDPGLGFGVSNLIWDAVVGTLLPIRG